MRESIGLYQAIKRMRVLTDAGIVFTFEFISLNTSKNASAGLKKVSKAQLRSGYRIEQSSKSNILIGYTNEFGQNRWFYLPLLTKFNNLTIKV